MKKKLVSSVRNVALLGLAFMVGWTTSLYATNTEINHGLVNALNSVGQNLFGDGVFGAAIVNPEVIVNPDVIPAVQLDVRDTSPVPILLSVFNQSCETLAQIQVGVADVGGGPGNIRMIINPDVLPTGATGQLVAIDGDLSAFPPGPCIPPDPILPPDLPQDG